MKIQVRDSKNKVTQHDIPDQEFPSLIFLKELIHKLTSIPTYNQIIFHKSTLIEDDEILQDEQEMNGIEIIDVLALNSSSAVDSEVNDTRIKRQIFEQHIKASISHGLEQRVFDLGEVVRAVSVDTSKHNLLMGTEKGSLHVYNYNSRAKVAAHEKIFDSPVMTIFVNFAASTDGKVVSYDEAFKKQKARWKLAHSAPLTSVVFERSVIEAARSVSNRSTKPELVWSTSLDKTIKQSELLEANKDKEAKVVKEYTEEVVPTALTMQKAKNGIVVGFENGSIRYYDDSEHPFIKIHKSKIIFLKEIEDSILTVCEDGTIQLSQIEDSSESKINIVRVYRQPSSESTVSSVAFNQLDVFGYSSYLVVGLTNGETVFYDIESGGNFVFSESEKKSRVACLYVSDNKSVISTHGDCKVVYSTSKNEEAYIIDHPNESENLTVLDCGRKYIAGALESSFAVWEKQTKEVVHIFKDVHKDMIREIRVSPNGKFVVTGAKDDKDIKVFDIQKKTLIHTFDIKEPETTFFSLDISPCSRYIATSSLGPKLKLTKNKIKLIDLETQKVRSIDVAGIEKNHQGFVQIKFTNDGKYLIGADDRSKSIVKIDIETGVGVLQMASGVEELATFGEQNYPKRFFLTPDNEQIVVYHTGKIELVNLKKAESSSHFEIPKENPPNFLTSNDAKYICLYDDNDEIHLYDIEKNEEIYSFEEISEEGGCFTYSQGNNYILAGGGRSSLKIYKNPVSSTQVSFITLFKEDGKDSKDLTPFSLQGPLFFFKFLQPHNVPKNNQIDVNYNVFKKKIDFIKRNQHTMIYPYRWTVLHLVCIYAPHKELIQACLQNGVKITLDKYGWTPIHYLLSSGHQNKNVVTYVINSMMSNPLDYIQKAEDVDKVMRSLMKDLPLIFDLLSPVFISQFLQHATTDPESYHFHSIPSIGSINSDSEHLYLTHDSLIFTHDLKSQAINEEGNDILSVKALQLHMDYEPHSRDMRKIVKFLSHTREEPIFQTKAINILLDYLWENNKGFHYILFTVFAAAVVLYSIYVTDRASYAVVGTISLGLTSVVLLQNLVQWGTSVRHDYAVDKTIMFGVLTNLFVLTDIVTGELNQRDYISQSFVAFGVLLAYLNLIIYTQVWAQSRKLGRVILGITRDIFSFLAFIIMILVAFTLVFAQLSPDQDTGFLSHLNNSLGLLTFDFDTTDFTVTQIIFFVFGLLVLAIVMLNLLISLVWDSFSRVSDRNVLYDGQEKSRLILQSIAIKRMLMSGESGKKGYLFIFEKNLEEDGSKKAEWEGGYNSVKKFMHNELSSAVRTFQDIHVRNLQEELIRANNAVLMEFDKKIQELGAQKVKVEESDRSAWT